MAYGWRRAPEEWRSNLGLMLGDFAVLDELSNPRLRVGWYLSNEGLA